VEKEAKARIKINKLLEESGWRLFDSAEGKANILLENNVKLMKTAINGWKGILTRRATEVKKYDKSGAILW
jgi:hypothetical protein